MVQRCCKGSRKHDFSKSSAPGGLFRFSDGEALRPFEAFWGAPKWWDGPEGLARCKQTKEFCREENLPDNFDIFWINSTSSLFPAAVS